MTRRGGAALLASVLAGCAAPRPARQQAPFEARLQVEAWGRYQVVPRPIGPGASLHSGDRFALRVGVDRTVHVYALSRQGDAGLRMLEAEAICLPGGTEVRLPGPGGYELDETPGEEELAVVASERPLDEGMCARLGLRPCPAPTECTRGGPPPPPKEKPPEPKRPAEGEAKGEEKQPDRPLPPGGGDRPALRDRPGRHRAGAAAGGGARRRGGAAVSVPT
jgi:hypothetical protein